MIERLLRCHHLENLVSHHDRQKPLCILRTMPRVDKTSKRFSRFGWRAIAELGVDDLQERLTGTLDVAWQCQRVAS